MKLLEQANGNIPRTEEEKKKMIEGAAKAYGDFLTALGFDWKKDENSENTPHRVAKAWVTDLISGTNTSKPKVTTFPTKYTGIVFEGDIDIVSLCSHHSLSFAGKAYIGYIPGDRVIGLSKLNRIADWYARRPQIQEGLTNQILHELDKILENNRGVIVCIRAKHTCCSHRGIKHDSTMITSEATGFFLDNKDGCKDEFFTMISQLK